MKIQFTAIFLAAMPLALVGVTECHAGTVIPTIEGIWSNPVLAGNIADGLTSSLTYFNNTGSAVYSWSNGPTGSSINWGTYNTAGLTNPPHQTDAGCAYLTTNFGVPCQSTVSFNGNAIPADPTIPFALGTLTYINGTSNLDSLIFGATLTFVNSANGQVLGSDFVQFVTTGNTGTAQQNADYLTFSGLSGVSFNVIEGATATAQANGYIDDVVIQSLTLTSDPATGFVGNSPNVSLQNAPEPASFAIFGMGLSVLGFVRRRRG